MLYPTRSNSNGLTVNEGRVLQLPQTAPNPNRLEPEGWQRPEPEERMTSPWDLRLPGGLTTYNSNPNRREPEWWQSSEPEELTAPNSVRGDLRLPGGLKAPNSNPIRREPEVYQSSVPEEQTTPTPNPNRWEPEGLQRSAPEERRPPNMVSRLRELELEVKLHEEDATEKDAELQRLQRKNADMTSKMEELKKKTYGECHICMDRGNEIVLKCGHACCLTCESRLGRVCDICRQPIEDRWVLKSTGTD